MNQFSAALMVLPTTCLLAWGWRRRLLALLAGLLSALAMPPLGIWPLLGLTIPCLVWLLDGAVEERDSAAPRWRSGFSIGWWFGFGFFLASLWWIGSAFLVEADRFAWMMPFAVVAMPLGLALFPGIALALAARLWPDGPSRILLLAIILSVTDFLRGHILTGFPWNVFGYAFGESLVLSQVASLIGIYGLGLIVLLVAASPALLVDPLPRRLKTRWLSAAGALLLAVALFGFVRLEGLADPGPSSVDVRIVQPSIPQDQKWIPENRERIFSSYLEMSQRDWSTSGREGAERLIVWPESAVPFLLTSSPEAIVRIANVLNGRASFATGAIRAENGQNGPAYFNSVYLFAPDGTVQDAYDKVRLVPFGEYLPLEGVLQWLGIRQLVTAPGAFEPGFRHKTLETPGGLRFLPMICYEVIFPEIARSSVERPDFFLNVTNDAWFGHTPGPFQHLAQARMRAVEQGVPLIRAANTGISAVFDAKGREIGRITLGEAGVLDVAVPGKTSATYYSLYGNLGFWFLEFVLLLLLLLQLYNRHSRQNRNRALGM